jgi:hypothetical protein
VGTDDYNLSLSRRRAINVMTALVTRGVPVDQLATVAIGKNQPVAPNSSEEGRARNRRVEFMISGAQPANLLLVQRRVIDEAYLRTNVDRPITARPPASVDVITLADDGVSTTQPANPSARPVTRIELQKPSAPEVRLNRPTDVRRATFNNEFAM